MNQKHFEEDLVSVLRSHQDLSDSEKRILKEKAVELALKNDQTLLKLLLEEEALKKHFFSDIPTKDGQTVVFDKDKFINFMKNKEFLQDSYTAFGQKIGLSIGGELLRKNKEVSLVWPYKDCVLAGGMTKEDQKRDEIFYNKTLAPDEVLTLLEPKVLTNFKRIDQHGEHKVKDLNDEDNLIIKGNNLLALHTLKKKYLGRVKLIYIDVPFNIDAEAFYNDRFNHSTWLTFMKNRLEIAKELLDEKGTIFIHCDDNELSYLKILADEVFKKSPKGKDNFVQYVEIKANVGAANEYQNPFMPKNCEYGLIYAKNYDMREYKPLWVKSDVDKAYNKIILNPEEKDFRKWEIGRVLDEFVAEKGEENKKNEKLLYDFVFKNLNRIFRTISPKGAGAGLKQAMNKSKEDTWAVYEREEKEDIICYKGEMVRFYSKNLKKDIDGNKIIGTELGSLWTDISWQGIAPEGGVKLKNGKKPEKLLRRIIEMNTKKEDIVLDFFLGSGTTAAVAHKLGRQYIGIEQLDYGKNDSVARLKNVVNGYTTGISKKVNWQGGGDLVYCELAKWNQKWVEKIESAETSEELLDLWNNLQENAFLNYKVDIKKVNEHIDDFRQLSIEEQKTFLLETLDMNQLYVNASEIDDETYNISDEEKKLNRLFWGE